jgi:predicted ATPase/DNA-binding SARP family transcriptional activator
MSAQAIAHSVESSEPIRVGLLGDFAVWVGGRPIPHGSWKRGRAGATIKLLALAPGYRLHREQLIDLLWPDADGEAAAANLRYVLHTTRRLLDGGAAGQSFCYRDGELVVLAPPGRVRTDVMDFEQALAAAWRDDDPALFQRAVDLYGGDLLPGDLYDDWAETRRTSLRAACLAALARLATLAEQRGNHGAAITALQQLLRTDPANEDAHVGLMRLYAVSGQPQHALAQFDLLTDVLRRELDVAPDAASRRLHDDIRAGRFPGTSLIVERATAATRHRLPAPLGATIGRERECAEVRQLLATSRLVTLVGPGGIGKTRMALEVGAEIAPTYQDGAVFVPLAAVTDPVLVPQAIAQALGLQVTGMATPSEAVATYLAERQLLLVVDNVEQVLDAAMFLVALLEGAPRLRLLVTSRARLRLRGERPYEVPPLAVPGATADPATIGAATAVRLFVERAREARPGFALSAEQAAPVAEICRRLDGLPLALELAAARVSVLAPRELLTRLDHALTLLVDGPRDLPGRQQTLRATIAWSANLLTPEARAIFRRLGVFVSGWTLDAAAAVAAWQPDEQVSLLARLDEIVEHHLVRRMDSGDDTPRFTMLETIREYALEQLEANGEENATYERHAADVLGLAETLAPLLDGAEVIAALDRLELEHANIRAALDWLVAAGDVERALRLGGAVWVFWQRHGHLHEGRARLGRLLALPDASAFQASHARVLTGAGTLAERQQDHDRANELLEEALAVWREMPERERRGVCHTLEGLGRVATRRGDYDAAFAWFVEMQEHARRVGDPLGLRLAPFQLGTVVGNRGDLAESGRLFRESYVLAQAAGDIRLQSMAGHNLGVLEQFAGRLDAARELLEEAVEIHRRIGDKAQVAGALRNLSANAEMRGDLDTAAAYAVELLALGHELGSPFDISAALGTIANVERLRGNLDRALVSYRESFASARAMQHTVEYATMLQELASVFVDRGEAAVAVQLLAASEAVLRALDAARWPANQEPFERTLAVLREQLPAHAFDAAWEAGLRMPPGETAREVLET